MSPVRAPNGSPYPTRGGAEPVAGKSLLIWPEQRFGDQIQFARFAPLLQQMGADVTLVCPPQLAALFQTLGVRIVEQSGETTLGAPVLEEVGMALRAG
jgi:hypothetical protein